VAGVVEVVVRADDVRVVWVLSVVANEVAELEGGSDVALRDEVAVDAVLFEDDGGLDDAAVADVVAVVTVELLRGVTLVKAEAEDEVAVVIAVVELALGVIATADVEILVLLPPVEMEAVAEPVLVVGTVVEVTFEEVDETADELDDMLEFAEVMAVVEVTEVVLLAVLTRDVTELDTVVTKLVLIDDAVALLEFGGAN
jgi:hypothetical protein